ncbi:elongation factor P [Oceanithermus sp.]
MISVTDLRPGTKVVMDGALWECVDYQHQKIGRGGAKVVAKFKNLETGATVERTFNSGEKLKDIYVEAREMQYLYPEGEELVLMDLETYEQYHVPRAAAGDAAKFLKEGITLIGDVYNGRVIKVTPPTVVELEVVEAPPGIKGDTASGGSKPATLETGAVVNVPLFIEAGEVIKIDTRTGEYAGRA